MVFQAGKDQKKEINSTKGEDQHTYKGIDETSVMGNVTRQLVGLQLVSYQSN